MKTKQCNWRCAYFCSLYPFAVCVVTKHRLYYRSVYGSSNILGIIGFCVTNIFILYVHLMMAKINVAETCCVIL